ncbi:MAG TPA: DUF6065 family protein [Bryobacteraceae bacterium]|jgi:hypothetical protein|nr:DUF6065 family protein [Bryobacteraceae bacterium]
MATEVGSAELQNPILEHPSIRAFRVPGYESYLDIVTAQAARAWMDEETKGWANRCLPLRIANQAGWWILNDADFEVLWTGRPEKPSIKIMFDNGQHSEFVSSMFGYGIVTWVVPYLFQTPHEVDLLVRGPANMIKDGAQPLEGLVETSWLPYPFTMNWKITRRAKWIRFRRGEPICMITPTSMANLEKFQPAIRNLTSDSALLERYQRWRLNREAAVEASPDDGTQGDPKLKQGWYIRGEDQTGKKFSDHRAKINLREFTAMDQPEIPDVRTEASPGNIDAEGGGVLTRLMRSWGLRKSER